MTDDRYPRQRQVERETPSKLKLRGLDTLSREFDLDSWSLCDFLPQGSGKSCSGPELLLQGTLPNAIGQIGNMRGKSGAPSKLPDAAMFLTKKESDDVREE